MPPIPAMAVLLPVLGQADPDAPYPPSSAIRGVTFDWNTHIKLAPGSDNWPITWADDDHQYTVWGDGGGFGGTNSLGRVSLGFARVEGTADSYTGHNIWGGHESATAATFGGKSYGIICVEGILYAWWGPGSGDAFPAETRVLRSMYKGRMWEQSEWSFTREDNLYAGTFCNFGRDNAGARDRYVYSYFPRGAHWQINKPGAVDLARVPKDRITARASYEFYAGPGEDGAPTWTRDLTKRKPVFEDPNGVRTASVGYNIPLKRYLLTTEHTEVAAGNLAIFDSPEPWGPWTTVAYLRGWGDTEGTISFYFAPKWFSADGTEFTLVFTDDDHWATIRGRLETTAR